MPRRQTALGSGSSRILPAIATALMLGAMIAAGTGLVGMPRPRLPAPEPVRPAPGLVLDAPGSPAGMRTDGAGR